MNVGAIMYEKIVRASTAKNEGALKKRMQVFKHAGTGYCVAVSGKIDNKIHR